jgi:hypothetical protein
MLKSVSFGPQKAANEHLTAGHGGVPGAVDDLRKDVDAGFKAAEGRVAFPELIQVKGPAVSAAGAAVQLNGLRLLQGQTFDSLALVDATPTTGLGSVTFTALKPGDSGLSVVVATGSSLIIAFANNTLTITLATGGSTDDAIATAVNADASACRGIIRAASGSLGKYVAAVAKTPLAGGVGYYAGNKVTASNTECLPFNTTGTAGAASWTDTGVKVTVPALTGQTPACAAADTVPIRISSNGVLTSSVNVTLAA